MTNLLSELAKFNYPFLLFQIFSHVNKNSNFERDSVQPFLGQFGSMYQNFTLMYPLTQQHHPQTCSKIIAHLSRDVQVSS